jgi:hypothetical protein
LRQQVTTWESHDVDGPLALRRAKPETAQYHDLRTRFSIGAVTLDFAVACWVPKGIPENRIHPDKIDRLPFKPVPRDQLARFKALLKDAEDFVAFRGRWAMPPPRDTRYNGKAYSLIQLDSARFSA